MITLTLYGYIDVKCQNKKKGTVYFNPSSRSLNLDETANSISSVNSNPENIVNKLTTALYGTSESYFKSIMVTAVTLKGEQSVFKIKDVEDVTVVNKNGKKLLKFKVSNSDLTPTGSFSKKATELKQQNGFSILNVSIRDPSKEICFFLPGVPIIPGLEKPTKICFPERRVTHVDTAPAISDGLTGFAPVTTPQENGWHRASTDLYGSWVFIQTKAQNGSYITCSWNESTCTLRAWCKGETDPAGESGWTLWEAAIPSSKPGAACFVDDEKSMFFGNGNSTNNGVIEFRNCDGYLCITPFSFRCGESCCGNGNYCKYECSEKSGPNCRPKWIQPVPPIPSVRGIYSPCPSGPTQVPCYLAANTRLLC